MICPRCGTQAGPDQQRCSRCAGSLTQPAPTDAGPLAVLAAPTRRGELRQAAEGTQTVSLVGVARARAAAAPVTALPAPVAGPAPFPVPPAALGEATGRPAAAPVVAPAPVWTAPEPLPEAWPPPPGPWGSWPPPPAEPEHGHSTAAQSTGRSAGPAAPRRPSPEGQWPSPPPEWGTPAPDRWDLAHTLPTTYWWQAVVVFLLVPPVGAAALYFSWQVTRRADIGDWGGSLRASRLARTCCLLGAFVAALAVLILLAGNSK